MNSLVARYLPWSVIALAAGIMVWVAARPAMDSGPMHLDEFGRLPAHEGGRIQPFDSVADYYLTLVSGRGTFRDADGVEHSAVKWLLDVMISPPSQGGPADKYKVFRIENDQILTLLGLTPRSGFRYSLEEFFPKLEDFYKQAKRAQKALKANPDKKLDLYDTKLLEMAEHFEAYVQLASFRAPRTIPPTAPGEKWRAYGPIEEEAKELAMVRIRNKVAEEGIDAKKLDNAQMKAWGDRFFDERDRIIAKLTPPAASSLLKILEYYKQGQAEEFNQAVAAYRTELQEMPAAEVKAATFESFFDHFAPFSICAWLYVVVFLLACIGWITYMGPLHRAAFWLAVVTLILHTWALGAHIYLNGRPPVTNLYSSAVFIGWGCVCLALLLERMSLSMGLLHASLVTYFVIVALFRSWLTPVAVVAALPVGLIGAVALLGVTAWVRYRQSLLGIGTALAATMGALTLIIAHFLGVGNDTLEPMQAVLATQFWLATHVVCVTFGYTATFVAGFLGMTFILLGVFTPWLTKDLFKILGRMIYGVVCFATLLSFVGTVLGGIWADQSWGRFWGWDPKENGALLIVLANALILHARWGGLVQQRGMAVLTVFGNIVTAWSWFGVNMLGVGLHSYGFIAAAVYGMLGFALLQLAIIAVGCLPLRMWRSFQPRKPTVLVEAPPEPLRRAGRGPSTAITPAS